MANDMRQLIAKGLLGVRDSATGTTVNQSALTVAALDVDYATAGAEGTFYGLLSVGVQNTGVTNSLDVEVWCSPNPNATFDPTDGGDFYPAPDFDDGSGVMVPVTIAALGKRLFSMVMYASTYRIVVYSSVNDSHTTYVVETEMKS